MKENITSVLAESRRFAPSAVFSKQAHISDVNTYEQQWRESKDQPEIFWAQRAKEYINWFKPFSKVLEWNLPDAKWFVGGRLNLSYNCLDRHLISRGKKNAIMWEGENGEQLNLTYRQLYEDVCRFSQGLESLGIKKGDRVTIYMPLVPELVIAVLSCARVGAVHNVVFGGFSAEALADRNNDSSARLLITADGGYRRGATVPLKANADKALEKSPTIEKVIVLRRTKESVFMQKGRDLYWDDFVADKSPHFIPEPMESEDPLFLLYTSGSTGKPKGILHTSAGYLLGAAYSFKQIFDYKEKDIYWCTADAGWITGHSYVIYGPLANGATVFLYEGAPNFPDFGRVWQMIERYKINIFYTAPTAIRSFMRAGDQFVDRYDLSSLRLIGTVGEPINPEAWMWYHQKIGRSRCPIVDTWWQTETGSIMVSPIPGITHTIPGSATTPFFGVVPEVVDKNGVKVPEGAGGFLVLRKPWPSMLRGIWGDRERFIKQYWSQIPGAYFTGDGARCDEEGNFWIMGRIDDVLNVSGHRLSTMEVESALVAHGDVAEAAVVGKPDQIKGESICAFVSLKSHIKPTDDLKKRLCLHVQDHIGALARPDEIRFTDALPKTRSGKIMRRLLRDIASGTQTAQDVSTLEDYTVLARLRDED